MATKKQIVVCDLIQFLPSADGGLYAALQFNVELNLARFLAPDSIFMMFRRNGYNLVFAMPPYMPVVETPEFAMSICKMSGWLSGEIVFLGFNEWGKLS